MEEGVRQLLLSELSQSAPEIVRFVSEPPLCPVFLVVSLLVGGARRQGNGFLLA